VAPFKETGTAMAAFGTENIIDGSTTATVLPITAPATHMGAAATTVATIIPAVMVIQVVVTVIQVVAMVIQVVAMVIQVVAMVIQVVAMVIQVVVMVIRVPLAIPGALTGNRRDTVTASTGEGKTPALGDIQALTTRSILGTAIRPIAPDSPEDTGLVMANTAAMAGVTEAIL
jgi:hypothetical protein